MAKLKSLLNIEGTIDGLSFYKTQDGYIVRRKGGFNGSRIINEPAYARTRENSKEFGNASKAGCLLRNSLKSLSVNASDNRVSSRSTQVMRNLLNYDTTSERGNRNVAKVILNTDAKAMVKDFNFNINAALRTILLKPFAVDKVTGIITINNFIPLNDLTFPVGATDVIFTGAWSILNFANEVFDTKLSNAVSLPINNTSENVTLTPSGIPKGTGTNIFAMQIVFLQTVNGQTYPLSNGAFNCLCIVDVS
ncbi:MAG: hypothetical protein WCO28_12690 [Bacteroidota bacterium]